MKMKDKRVLELVKEKPMPISELRKELLLSTAEMRGALTFLQKYELVETLPVSATAEDGMVWIMPKGAELLNMPDLAEEESVATPDGGELQNFEWADLQFFLLKGVQRMITEQLGIGEGTITIEQRSDKFILTAFIPKEGEMLHLQKGDIPKCHHTTEEVKEEVDALFKRRRDESNER